MQRDIIYPIILCTLMALATVSENSNKSTNQGTFDDVGSNQFHFKFGVTEIAEKYEDSKPNPEELGTYFEGDIHNPMVISKNGLLNHNFRWKNGVVPIEVRGDFGGLKLMTNSKELTIINTAFKMYHNLTCIQFIQHSTEKDYVTITKNPTGCWSSLGKIGGNQILNLQSPKCFIKVGTTIHELMHVLGFNHEHTREDRDEYVEINWKNIPTSSYVNFGKSSPNSTNTFEIKYDYESVLHYSPYAFAMDSLKPTLVPLKKIGSSMKMGQRDGLSKSDVKKIWKMYKCKTTTLNLLNTNKTTRFKNVS